MSASFLCGMLAAWAVVQVALSAFFVTPYLLRRREPEYLLFGLLCLALAVTTGGFAGYYAFAGVESFPSTALYVHLGALPAVALNLHFVLRYVELPNARRLAIAGYLIAAVHIAAVLGGLWWEPGSMRVVTQDVFGARIEHVVATPTLTAWTAYAIIVIELVASAALLVRSVGSRKKEGLSAAAAGLLVVFSTVHDVLVVTGRIGSILLLPHAFLLYSFAVASTVVVRYGRTAGALEAVAVDLRQRTEELRSSHAELLVVQDELSQKQQLAHLGELAAAIAHEVRNPLAVIMNAVSSLRRHGLSGDDHEMLLGIVEEETTRLNRLVTDLLRFARPVSIERAAVSLVEMARRAETLVEAMHRLDVAFEDDPAVQTVWADAGLLRLVFDNVVANARQAMPEGGTLSIHVRRAQLDGIDYVRVDIGDTGHGMDEDVMKRATDPFYTTRPSGTGLGLPIVERIIAAHHGRISIESRAGVGTTLSLFLPLGEPERLDAVLTARAFSAPAGAARDPGTGHAP